MLSRMAGTVHSAKITAPSWSVLTTSGSPPVLKESDGQAGQVEKTCALFVFLSIRIVTCWSGSVYENFIATPPILPELKNLV